MNSVPSHVGIIMDGNGRWAIKRGKNRSYGHKAGSDNVEKIASYAFKKGVRTLSLYAFSSENWARPKEEVDELMHLLDIYIKKFVKKLVKKGVKLSIMGDLSKLSPKLQETIKKSIEECRDNKLFILNIGINYGGRQEIVRAVNKLIEQNKEITDKSILENLDTASFGEPDLIIRTGGEYRLSNFMLYQGAYSELYFSDVLWPDFNEEEFDKALVSYSNRNRRYGKI